MRGSSRCLSDSDGQEAEAKKSVGNCLQSCTVTEGKSSFNERVWLQIPFILDVLGVRSLRHASCLIIIEYILVVVATSSVMRLKC